MQRALGLVLVVAAMAVAGCGEPRVVELEADGSFPTQTLTDWVSYGDQLSVVSVIDETPPDLPPDWKNSGGIIGRKVTMRIERTLWQRPRAPSVGGEIRFDTWGWMMESDQEADSPKHPIAPATGPRLEVGGRYLAFLVRYRGEWTPITEATLPLDGDVVTDEGVHGRPAGLPPLDGKTVGEAAAVVAATKPDPAAAAYGHLPPQARAVKAAG